MYCPNCELEIKGDEQKTCPICNTALVENPFAAPPPSDDFSETELRLKELIRDIDEKVNKNLEGVAEEQAFSLDSGTANPAEPSPGEFALNLDAEKEGAAPETLEAGVFHIPEEQQSADDQKPEPVFDLSDITAPEGGEPEPPSAARTEPDLAVAAESSSVSAEKAPPPIELEDTVEIARFNVKPSPPQHEPPTTTTKEILDKALDELESEQPVVPEAKKKSLALPVLIGALMLAIVCAAGVYFLKFQTSPVTPPAKQPPAVMKKVRPAPQPRQKAVPDNMTRGTAAAPTTAPAAPAQPTVAPDTAVTPPAGQAAPAPAVPIPAQQIVAPVQPPRSEAPKTAVSVQQQQQQQPAPENAEISAAEPVPASTLQKQPAADKPVSRKAAPGTFSIHAGSFRSEKTAAREVKRFEAAGLDAYAEQTDLGPKGVWFRVKIGSFPTRETAERALQQFLAKEPGDARIVINK